MITRSGGSHWLMTCCVLSIRPMHHLHVTTRVTAAVGSTLLLEIFYIFKYICVCGGSAGEQVTKRRPGGPSTLTALLHPPPCASAVQEAFDTGGDRPSRWRDHHNRSNNSPYCIYPASSRDGFIYALIYFDVNIRDKVQYMNWVEWD